jgi:hypothetical protein
MNKTIRRTFTVSEDSYTVLKVHVAHKGGSVNDIVSAAIDKAAEKIRKDAERKPYALPSSR